MTTNFEDVQAFHRAFGQIVPETFSLPSDELIELRIELIAEELAEMVDELSAEEVDPLALSKEIADLLYVVYGLAATLGIPIDAVFKEVHRSNMSKLGSDGKPIYRSDGKIMKSENYSPADLSKIVR